MQGCPGCVVASLLAIYATVKPPCLRLMLTGHSLCLVPRLRGCTMAPASSWRTLCRRRSASQMLPGGECQWAACV